jgi:hypothetical protein
LVIRRSKILLVQKFNNKSSRFDKANQIALAMLAARIFKVFSKRLPDLEKEFYDNFK